VSQAGYVWIINDGRESKTMAIEHDLRAMYNDSTLREIATAAKQHAELVARYGEDRRMAKIFGDVHLALTQFLSLPKE
jgi:hypothetical protein